MRSPSDTKIRAVSRLEQILTRDYMPSVNPFIRWMWTPLGALGVAAFASLLCGIVLHSQALLLTFALVAMVVIGTIWPWICVRGLSGSLAFSSERAREGDTLSALLKLRNYGPWACWGVAVRGGAVTFAGLPRVPGWRSIDRRITFDVDRRGVYPLGPIRVSSGFPFGFWEPGRTLNVTHPLIVWPKTHPVGPIPSAAGDRAISGSVTVDRPGVSGDFAGVRDYRRGDSLRSIHWPQTARHGRMIVCERQSETMPWVQVMLEVDPEIHIGAGADSSRECAIRIAASFMEHWIDAGAVMEAILGETFVSPRSGTAQKRKCLDALACLKDGGPSLDAMLDSADAHPFAGGLRVVITTDRGLARLQKRSARDASTRFVVLKLAGFADELSLSHVSPMPIRPWIIIDGLDDVGSRLKTSWKEAVRGV